MRRMHRAEAEAAGFGLVLRQTNAEHQMIDWLQEVRVGAAGVVINPAAFTYAAYGVLDAIKMVDCPVMEVHISNIHKREAFRHHSFVSSRADGVIAGCGTQGYVMALHRLAHLLA